MSTSVLSYNLSRAILTGWFPNYMVSLIYHKNFHQYIINYHKECGEMGVKVYG